MSGYYDKKLAAQRLKKCYDIASPRVRQYFTAELDYVLGNISPGDRVLDLGCGYGRILAALADKAGIVVGLDNSDSSLNLAKETIAAIPNCVLVNANAVEMNFPDGIFDVVVCIQNGISAFHVDRQALIRESLRVTKPGGVVLFSSYSHKFWEHRLEWFRDQANAGLLGEIDEEKTGDGIIVCKDGFQATTVGEAQFCDLAEGAEADVDIVEVDESSFFCRLRRKNGTGKGWRNLPDPIFSPSNHIFPPEGL